MSILLQTYDKEQSQAAHWRHSWTSKHSMQLLWQSLFLLKQIKITFKLYSQKLRKIFSHLQFDFMFQECSEMLLDIVLIVKSTLPSCPITWRTNTFPIRHPALNVGRFFSPPIKWGPTVVTFIVMRKIFSLNLITKLLPLSFLGKINYLYSKCLLLFLNLMKTSDKIYLTGASVVSLSQFPTIGGGVCPICSKSIVSNLKRHVEDLHCPGEFHCPHCGKMFSSKNKLASHVSQTCREKRKIQSIKSAKWTIYIKGTLISGQFGNTPGLCPFCQKFVQNIAYHVEDKHIPNPTPCTVCGKVFQSTNKMRAHRSYTHRKTS